MENIIITGMSGAGKTQAMQILEELGFFCVDNLPPQLIPTFLELCQESAKNLDKVALVTDIRGEIFRDPSCEEKVYYQIKDQVRYFFLDARDDVLISRYQESRRSHPLSEISGSLIEAIARERQSLAYLKDLADVVIDTSEITTAELRETLLKALNREETQIKTKVKLYSFGYKYESPVGADFVFDVRFLKNPFYLKELRTLTGKDKEVQDYVMSFAEAKTFYDHLLALLSFVIPEFKKVSKPVLEVAIGCTGGQHRSVTFAELLAKDLKLQGLEVTLLHRDMDKNVHVVKKRENKL
ncbi:RNase adapter RapZ [Eubacteriaceae bacterium ES3]|nr:RNase adapter RapZ [Eubacteriaceae bacterium ES3]